MQKIKNKLYTKIIVFLLEIVLISNPLFVVAQAVPYDITKNIHVSGDNIWIDVKFNEADTASFIYATYVDPLTEEEGADMMPIVPAAVATCSDSALNPLSVLTTGTSPASGFCDGIAKCNNADNIASIIDCSVANNCAAVKACGKAVATAYNKKIVDALQAATDKKISDNGLDVTGANSALEACGGNLICIDNVLLALQSDSAFSDNTQATAEGPLTAGDVSDFINAGNNEDVGAINSTDNDKTGLSGKTTGPKVEIAFSPSGPAGTGAIMSANAVPSFFNNASDPSNLYFTWYLKRNGCEAKDSGVSENDPCNLDGNNKIDVNDWKIAAAKIIVANSFDREGANYNSFPSGITKETAGYVAIPEIIKKDPDDKSKSIGWRKGFLRDDNNELYLDNGDSAAVANCYVQAPISGRPYELRMSNPTFSDSCPVGYHQACVSDQKAGCNVLNSLFSQSASDAATTAIPPVPYLISKSVLDENFSACAVSSEKTASTDANVSCSIQDEADLKNFKASVSCNTAGEIAVCVKDNGGNTDFKNNSSTIIGTIIGKITGESLEARNARMCTSVAKPDTANSGLFLSSANQLISKDDEKCSVVVDKIINGTKTADGATDVSGNINLSSDCSYEKGANLCKHLFPVLPKEIKKDNGEQAISGDGEFNLKEKEFWGADPTKASTNGNGKDEERAVGLGMDKFDWMFSPGDKIGVVVEGDSVFPSDHPDASYRRMWAFSKGTCKALNEMENDSPGENKRGFYLDGSMGILTAKIDLNDCLEENLLDPSEEGIGGLTVQLNANPENPINDPAGKGDILNIVSTALNTQDSSGLLYKWSVQISKEGSTSPIETTGWLDITSKLQAGGSFSEGDVEGLGKKDLAIDLNIQNSTITDAIANAISYTGTFYLKIKVKIEGTAADGSQNASGFVIVRVKQQENEMLVFPVSATQFGMVNLNKGLSGQSLERCSEPAEKAICYVSKNEIVGLEVPMSSSGSQLSNFSWTVNGNELSCNSSISSECTTGGNKFFFPVLGNEGEAVDVVAKAIKKDATGVTDSIEVSRRFVIARPGLQIMSMEASNCSLECLNDNAICPKYLGFYKDLVGGQVADCSSQVWETSEGSMVNLGATGQTGFDWTVDGQILSQYTDQNKIQLSIDKKVGESYNVGVVSYLLPENRAQINNTRLALYKNWGITQADSIDDEENQSASMQIDVVRQKQDAVASGKQSFFGASLITHLPEQILFLFEIIVASIAMFFVTGLLFAFMPEAISKKE